MGFFFSLLHLFFPVLNFKIKGCPTGWQTQCQRANQDLYAYAITKQSGKIIQFLFLNGT